MMYINGEDATKLAVQEVEHHFHNHERWLGNGAVADSLTGYQLTSGNAAFGSEVELLTAVQTPIQAGHMFFDLHSIFITALTSATPYILRFIFGTGTVAAAEAAGQYTSCLITSSGVGTNLKGSPTPLLMARHLSGTKIWAKCKNATNLATIDILIGIHEYKI